MVMKYAYANPVREKMADRYESREYRALVGWGLGVAGFPLPSGLNFLPVSTFSRYALSLRLHFFSGSTLPGLSLKVQGGESCAWNRPVRSGPVFD